MELDRDEVLVAVPSSAEMPSECRHALEAYATRPILRRANVGLLYVIASSRIAEIEQLAGNHKLPLQRLSSKPSPTNTR